MAAKPRLSLILVCFGSSDLAAGAVESFRAEADELGATAEIVLVDHSQDETEARRLARLAGTVVVQDNRGYAGGINAGVAAARGEVLLFGNPDVQFLPGSVAALLRALDEGWDVVGPQFVLGDLLLAPADEQGLAAELRRAAAARWPWAWRRLLRREVGRWLRVWRAGAPVPVRNLSGALLATRAASWQRFGPWDERYFLYFEETDWLRRVRRAGARVAVVPGARVTHLWGHATEPGEHAHHFAASRERYLTRSYGPLGRLVARLRVGPARVGALPPWSADSVGDENRLWLVSPTGDGLHAATPAPGAGPVLDVVRTAVAERGRPTSAVVVAWDVRRRRPVGLRRWEV